jgi:hypothetical protein
MFFGSSTETIVPEPSSLLMVSFPSCNPTNPLTIESPNPVPSAAISAWDDARENGSVMFSKRFSDMPNQ